MMDIIENLSIKVDTTLIEVLNIIEKSEVKIAFVIDNNKKLIGTITDGDIRRSLLQGKNLQSNAIAVMNKNFRYVKTFEDEMKARILMKKEMIKVLPVLSIEGKITRILLSDNLIPENNLENTVFILAGGKGTRLLPHTKNCPKPMLKISGQPILEIILKQCLEFGFNNFIFSVNYLKEQIIDYFGNGDNYNAKIQYIVEDKPLGTAGSLSLLGSKLKHPIIIMNGDVLTQLNLTNLLNYHLEKNAYATICVREHISTNPYGVVKIKNDQLENFEEKPIIKSLINAGVYIINPELINLITKDEFLDMPDLLIKAKNEGKNIFAYPIHEYWIDIGRYETFEIAEKEWK